MKRQTNTLPGQGADRDIGSRPVETTQHANVTRETEVKIPTAQGARVALSFAVAVGVTIISPIAIGPRIFYAVAGLVALAAFLWSLQYELYWQDRVSLPFLTGIVAWCFWRFADFAGWRVPESWQPFAAIGAVISLVFWWTFTLALWLTFWQRLGMPMYHQQYSIWRALGSILEHWGKKERVPVAQDVDEDPPIRFEFHLANGSIRHNRETPQPRSVMVWVARILIEKTFSEANLCGTDKPLPGGVGGREQLDELREWMIDNGILSWCVTNGDGEPVRRQGVELTTNGARWVEMVSRLRDDE